ncbi:hypothetical protein [Pseudomaricurvus sp. HS19]|uniref:hypothetical protein n=1 Tax=Pseudomaricurvus sp. HS19 TaxID=2692626 RepID=UPI00136ED410|nr:hypothetical protein [Pseudomaricurvus sp. HS19]MYM64353.1 hypothetical protein [Pseudomaricurvus sp. HS19]
MNSESLRTVAVTAQQDGDLQLQPGQRYALRYEILQLLGRDGNGAWYLARDRHSGEELRIHIQPPRR